MKNIYYILILTLYSCNSVNNFYQGRVIDEKNNPIEGVIVAEDHIEKHTKTDKDGYFKLDRSPDWLGRLIFIKEGYKTDTIPTVWHQGEETTEYNFIKKDTTIVRLKTIESKEHLDLTITQPKSENREIPKSWESLNAIQKDWIEVKKDEKGYLIYDPCDGYTRRITFKNGYLYIQWQMEPEYKFYIDKFTRMTDNKSFRIDAYEENTQSGFPISAKIIDDENGLVLWEFGNEMEKEKWLMTPFENAENFRTIKNNCPDYKREELKFIE